jgi:arylsulfatase
VEKEPKMPVDTEGQVKQSATQTDNGGMSRRNILLAGTSLVTVTDIGAVDATQVAQAQQQPSAPPGRKPNILVIFGDDIGQTNISAYSFGVVGYKTPNIDRIAKEGMMFTDYYAENSCTAGRAAADVAGGGRRDPGHNQRGWDYCVR